MDEAKYCLVDSDSEDGRISPTTHRVLFKDPFHRRLWGWRRAEWFKEPWKYLTLFWATVSLALLIALVWPRGSAFGTYEDGFATDMGESLGFENSVPEFTNVIADSRSVLGANPVGAAPYSWPSAALSQLHQLHCRARSSSRMAGEFILFW